MKSVNSTAIKKTFYFVIGTRAQLIKTAPVMREFERRGEPYVSIYTGQHKETIEDIWQEFGLRLPDIRIRGARQEAGKYAGNGAGEKEASTIGSFLGWWFKMLVVLVRPRKILRVGNGTGKGIIITHGDTITALWGALLGKLSGNKVAHLESGLRSFNLFHPFPEEIIRILTFWCTDYYFCPNQWAIGNLRKFRGQKIDTGGNTLIDAVRIAQTRIAQSRNSLTGGDPAMSRSRPDFIPDKPYAVVSMHRFENLYPASQLASNLKIIEAVAQTHHLVFVLHPVTKNRLIHTGTYKILADNKNISLQNRLGFFDFIALLSKSEFLITDGGSNQEESSYLGLPCLLLRHKTERIEGLEVSKGRDANNANVVLSDYNMDVIQEFASSYKKYRKTPVIETKSPARFIADYLISL